MSEQLPSTDNGKLHIDLMFPSEFIRCGDLREKDVPLTIHRVSMRDLKRTDGSKTRLPVMEFSEMQARSTPDQKKLVLNKTNAKTVAALYGGIANDWVGKRIILYPTKCEAFGKTVDCIRIRDHAPPDPQKEPEEPTEHPAAEPPEGALTMGDATVTDEEFEARKTWLAKIQKLVGLIPDDERDEFIALNSERADGTIAIWSELENLQLQAAFMETIHDRMRKAILQDVQA